MPGAGTNGAPGIKPMHGLRQILGNQPTFSTTLVSAHTVHPLLVDDALILRLKGAGDRQGSAGGLRRLSYANLVQRRRSGRAGASIRGALRVNGEKAFGAGLREFLTGDRRFSWLTASQGAGHGCCMYRAPHTKDMLSEMKTLKPGTEWPCTN